MAHGRRRAGPPPSAAIRPPPLRAFDCYQPVERRLQLTRRRLEVFLKFGNPVNLITKNHLVTRDLDILGIMETPRLGARDPVHHQS